MGATGSVMAGTLVDEAAKPADGSDVAEDPIAEVVRLRALIKEAHKSAADAEGEAPATVATSEEEPGTVAVPPVPPAQPAQPAQLVPDAYVSASEILRCVHSKEKACVDVVGEALARIAATSEINACIEVLADSALAKAAEVDAKIAAGEALGQLEGLPILIKCNIDGPPGSLTSASTHALAEWRPQTNAPCVAKLLEAGAIPIAKTNMPQLAVGVNAMSPLYGRTLNPHNLTVNAGASSSGTAAAIAAGIASCGLGSDTGGSLRIPASCCGIVGVRPSRGRWPSGGVVPCSSLRDTVGPMGSCVADAALLDSVVSGEEVVTKPDSLSGVKIAIPQDWISAMCPNGQSQAATKALEAAKVAFEAAGAEVLVVDGMNTVRQTAKDQWVMPVLPAVYEDCHADLTAYLEGCGEGRPVATVEDVLAAMPDEQRVKYVGLYGLKEEGDAEKIKVKIEKRDEAVANMEAAYREWFASNGVSAMILPAFANEPTTIDIEGEAGKNFMNEFLFSFHMNECRVPSMAIPIKSVKFPESGVPTSILMYGVEDRPLYGLALALEASLTA